MADPTRYLEEKMLSDYVNSWPTARTRHRCGVCGRLVMPGETYWRQAGLDRGAAWTNKTCAHCERVIWAYNRVCFQDEWYAECVMEWLDDEYPTVFAQMRSGWRWPDGELLPLPFGSTCIDCGVRVEFRYLWCDSCDAARIARINHQFEDISAGRDQARVSS